MTSDGHISRRKGDPTCVWCHVYCTRSTVGKNSTGTTVRENLKLCGEVRIEYVCVVKAWSMVIPFYGAGVL
jgi:hypothetical protein